MPMTASGRFVRAAISVIEIELVFVARIAPGWAMPVEVGEDLELEVVALGGRLDDHGRAGAAASSAVAVVMRGQRRIACRRVERALLHLAVEVPRDRRRVPSRARRRATSIIVTSKPLCANTCAMPLPIWPAPITAIRSLMRQAPGGALGRRNTYPGGHRESRERRTSRPPGPTSPPVAQSGPDVHNPIVRRGQRQPLTGACRTATSTTFHARCAAHAAYRLPVAHAARGRGTARPASTTPTAPH